MNIKLNVIYDNMIVSIPFKSILNIDEFTKRFAHPLEICTCINRLYDLGIDKKYFVDTNISYDHRKRDGSIASRELPVVFYSDNYDFDSVKDMYVQFFKDDRTRLREWKYGVRNVKKHRLLDDYVFGRSDRISDSEIESVIDAYFSGSSYLKYRDAYFSLIENGYDVIINENNLDEIKPLLRTDLSYYDSEDTYFQSLINMSKLGEDEADKVIEILSLHDLEEIKKGIDGSRGTLFDGNMRDISNKQDIDLIYENDRMALECFTGMRIDELKELSLYKKIGRRR